MLKRKNSLPKISIITPSFNQVDFIERTIRSVIEQKYPNLEYIIKDGGSVDGSLKIIKDYAKRYPKIIKWISMKDKGQADGINQGLKIASGEILAYLNSDDTYPPEIIKKVAKFFNENPDVMWVTGKCKIIDENDKEIRSWIKIYKNFWLKFYHYKTLLIIDYISQPATFWRKKALEEIGYFNPRKQYTMDYDYWLRLGKKYPPGIIWEYLANFRVHQTSKGRTRFVEQFAEDLKTAKDYTKNPILINLHRFSNFGITTSYWIIAFMARIFKFLRE